MHNWGGGQFGLFVRGQPLLLGAFTDDKGATIEADSEGSDRSSDTDDDDGEEETDADDASASLRADNACKGLQLLQRTTDIAEEDAAQAYQDIFRVLEAKARLSDRAVAQLGAQLHNALLLNPSAVGVVGILGTGHCGESAGVGI